MAAKAMPREAILALRESIARIEGKSIHAARVAAEEQDRADIPAPEDAGLVSGFDDLLGEIARPGAMTEIRSTRLGEAGATSGFAMALALSRMSDEMEQSRCLLIGDPLVVREAGLPYAPGLGDFGFRPGEMIHALPRRIEDALWLTEAALTCNAFAAVLLEIHGNSRHFGLTESRRLSLRVRDTGTFLVILRHAGEEEASSASLRLKVEPAPAQARLLADGSMLGGSIGNPVFHVLVEKGRSAALSEFLLEWNPHDRRLHTIPALHAAHHVSWRPPHPGHPFPASGDGSAGAPALGSVLAFDRAS